MRYLIDTHIFLYLLLDNSLIYKDCRSILENYENEIILSTESVKEIIHLHQNGKIKTVWKKTSEVINIIDEFKIKLLSPKKEHLLTLSKLDLVAKHNDPSDRMIIAQAITEKLPLISNDRMFENYKKQKLDLIVNKK
jgi:tRNA(fMet)-specific endonuclease VapC